MTKLVGPTAQRFSVLEIRRAIAHHRRAIQALHDQSAFQGIDVSTTEQLITKLETDLRRLEDQLGRTRMSGLADRSLKKTVPVHPRPDDVTFSPIPAR